MPSSPRLSSRRGADTAQFCDDCHGGDALDTATSSRAEAAKLLAAHLGTRAVTRSHATAARGVQSQKLGECDDRGSRGVDASSHLTAKEEHGCVLVYEHADSD